MRRALGLVHSCSITPTVDGRWQVMCTPCGQVGPPQEIQYDALAIARRHEHIGGFER